MIRLKNAFKITRAHCTVTPTAAKLVDEAHRLDEVQKISIGIIKHIGNGGERRLKFLPITGGIKAKVRGNAAVQEIYIYTRQPFTTRNKLLLAFSK